MLTWLSPAGAAAAALVGAAVFAGAGWRGFVLLVVFFVSASALTRGGGRRTPVQVFANGGVAALAALLVLHDSLWLLAFGGALAAAAADTWSTEIGSRASATPRLITTGRPVPPGTSGGVTWRGSLGGVAGAAALAAAAVLVGLLTPLAGAWTAAAGVGGGLADSLLGAALQARFRCAACGAIREVRRCGCGGDMVLSSGAACLNNDGVNLACTLAGAAIAWAPAALGIISLG